MRVRLRRSTPVYYYQAGRPPVLVQEEGWDPVVIKAALLVGSSFLLGVVAGVLVGGAP